MCFVPPGMLWFTGRIGGKLLNYVAWYLATVAYSVERGGSWKKKRASPRTGSHVNSMWVSYRTTFRSSSAFVFNLSENP